MLSFLKKPYPYYSFSVKEVISNFFVGCFVALFLIVFQPFGISVWETPHKLLKLIGFGFISFICPVIYRIIISYLLKKYNPEDTWQVWKEIVSMVLVLLFIALANLCFANFIHIASFGLYQFLAAALGTLLIAVFPVTANVAVKYNRFLALNRKEAQHIEEELVIVQHQAEEQQAVTGMPEDITDAAESNTLIFTSENEKDRLELTADELVYIESADNYSTIVFIKDNRVQKLMLRSSLKRLESLSVSGYVIRCHRSYMVNLLKIKHVEGNAQGYRITFKEHIETEVPVSRNYSKLLFERLEILKLA